MKVKDSLLGDFLVSILIEDEVGGDWWFCGVYGPPRRENRKNLWDELVGLRELCGNRWCVGGDFNIVRRVSEKFNSSTNTRSMKEFDSLIREMDLVDLSLCNASFTWTNFRVVPICCRLDRYLFSNNWAAGFEFCRQEAEAMMVSDHSPVILDICPPKWALAPFLF
ncbi:Endonuclease/exonuclease/phosphatase [Parasponia andersonii]|uniref:Endonuclease/exonuclease/phosphatase n=1 Tax=Parasponia andersonii TaxID=3476 RepID=A0A2P5DKU8_PARAD|nr:Endonuclease/exonuclease/phosphatase [Parasponia andersonii]